MNRCYCICITCDANLTPSFITVLFVYIFFNTKQNQYLSQFERLFVTHNGKGLSPTAGKMSLPTILATKKLAAITLKVNLRNPSCTIMQVKGSTLVRLPMTPQKRLIFSKNESVIYNLVTITFHVNSITFQKEYKQASCVILDIQKITVHLNVHPNYGNNISKLHAI